MANGAPKLLRISFIELPYFQKFLAALGARLTLRKPQVMSLDWLSRPIQRH